MCVHAEVQTFPHSLCHVQMKMLGHGENLDIHILDSCQMWNTYKVTPKNTLMTWYPSSDMFFCLFVLFSGSAYYDNVRPLSYPDSDAVLICFDISKAETLDSVLKKVSAP